MAEHSLPVLSLRWFCSPFHKLRIVLNLIRNLLEKMIDIACFALVHPFLTSTIWNSMKDDFTAIMLSIAKMLSWKRDFLLDQILRPDSLTNTCNVFINLNKTLEVVSLHRWISSLKITENCAIERTVSPRMSRISVDDLLYLYCNSQTTHINVVKICYFDSDIVNGNIQDTLECVAIGRRRW